MPSRLAIAAPLIGLMALAAPDARAQCAFDQSTPNAGDVLSDPQPTINIQFMLEIDLQEVRIVDAANTVWPTDWVRTPQEVRNAEFRATKALPPGSYLIEWNGYLRRHYHADGGSIPFTVAAAGDGGAPPSPAAEPRAAVAPRTAQGSLYRAFLGAAAPQPGR